MHALECAVFNVGAHAAWSRTWIARHRQTRHLVLHEVPLCDVEDMPDVAALQRVQADLYRFQVCLVPVDPENLSWTRTALAMVKDFTIPHLGLSCRLRAEALGDLLQFGLTDFVTAEADVHELRTRCLRVTRPGARSSTPRNTAYTVMAKMGSQQVADIPLAYESQLAGQPEGSHTTTAHAGLDSNHFRVAKQRLIDTFEVDFLHQSLKRNRGNVTRAARESDKHRRAFWALMRKHQINARVYRTV